MCELTSQHISHVPDEGVGIFGGDVDKFDGTSNEGDGGSGALSFPLLFSSSVAVGGSKVVQNM